MIIIGITGKKRAGKDSVCSIIQQQCRPNTSIRLAFADALKKEVAKAIGKDLLYVEENKIALRLLLQAWGTDFRRNLCDKNYWTAQLLRSIIDLPPAIQTVVVPDVRFENEAAIIHELNGFVIRVVRPSDSVADTHASEVEMDRIIADYGIVNDSSLYNLEIQTTNVFNNIKNKCINPLVQ